MNWIRLEVTGVGLALLLFSCAKAKTEVAADGASESAAADAGTTATSPAGKSADGERTDAGVSSSKPDLPSLGAGPDAGCAAVEGEQLAEVCTLEPNAMVPRCGDGIINLEHEQCDGSALPATAPPGSSCSDSCTLLMPTDPNASACANCATLNCAMQRSDLDSVLPLAEPLVECVLGADWQTGARAAPDSCSNNPLQSCYCGSVPTDACETSSSAAVDGPCASLILEATGCPADAADSVCVAQQFLSSGTLNGKVMQYVECRQDFCYDDCFSPSAP